MGEIELSYCIVNTSQRELMLRGLDAIAHERAMLPFASEVLVLDNDSRDGSAQAAREHLAVDEVIALAQRQGKAASDSELLRRARGRYALLLNEDSELQPGATLALHEALERRTDAACAGAKLLRPRTAGAAAREHTPQGSGSGWQTVGLEQACAWRFPTPLTALAGALFLQRIYTLQSKGGRTREVDWCQSSALLVRREAAAQVDYLDPEFFVYSDEVDFARRLRDSGWRSLYVPSAVAIHHEQLSTGAVPERRIVELSRNRDLYMRKHHSSAAARAVRWLTALAYAERALAALVLPGHSAKRYLRHVTATLFPSRGEGLREAADVYNRSSK
ncbi:MAG TPA: glycosyltransferase [Solirubrobacteraceae bacterium]|jgi:GT2 family glycosyltransferase|nr:glycosyltransferase [Solirubrobacteraceae bacterium]